MSGRPVGASAALARFAATSDLPGNDERPGLVGVETIAALVRDAARGCGDTRLDEIRAELGEGSPGEEATVIGTRVRLGAAAAAMANAAACAAADPPGARMTDRVVAAAACAMAERAGTSTAETLTAVLVGCEVAERLVEALGDAHVARGWWVAGTAGRVGAAAAAARAGGLDEPQHLVALAFASTQAAGLASRPRGTEALLVAGRAAHDGVECAELARAGLSAPLAAIEGRRGLLALMSDHADIERLCAGLGSDLRICSPQSEPLRDATFAAVLAAVESGTVSAALSPQHERR